MSTYTVNPPNSNNTNNNNTLQTNNNIPAISNLNNTTNTHSNTQSTLINSNSSSSINSNSNNVNVNTNSDSNASSKNKQPRYKYHDAAELYLLEGVLQYKPYKSPYKSVGDTWQKVSDYICMSMNIPDNQVLKPTRNNAQSHFEAMIKSYNPHDMYNKTYTPHIEHMLQTIQNEIVDFQNNVRHNAGNENNKRQKLKHVTHAQNMLLAETFKQEQEKVQQTNRGNLDSSNTNTDNSDTNMPLLPDINSSTSNTTNDANINTTTSSSTPSNPIPHSIRSFYHYDNSLLQQIVTQLTRHNENMEKQNELLQQVINVSLKQQK